MSMIQVTSTKNKLWSTRELIEDTNIEKFNIIITNEKRRDFNGFGCCFNELSYKALLSIGKDSRNKILDQLFSLDGECRFTFGRIPIGANDYSLKWYSYNEVENDYNMDMFSIEEDKKLIIPFIKEALKRNPHLEIISSPWSPPTWMKTHQVYNFGKLIWEERILDSYAKYFMKFVKSYEMENIKIKQLHIQNEVVANQKFPSCTWTGPELRDFIKYYLGPLFKKHHIDTEIWLGTINAPEFDKKGERHEDYDLYAGLVLRDEEAYNYIAGVGYQWAGRHALQQTVSAYPEKKYLQTESECGNGENSWYYAEYIFSLIRFYIINGVNGYLYWNSVLYEGGESTWGWRQNSMISIDHISKEITYNPEFYLITKT